MSTPLPGQIRCPTCHRSTPPAAFCTQCGSEIPASARARPRGLDREELQDRIRVHRPGDAPFRRGAPVGEGHDPAQSPYQPFRPEPEDGLIVPAAEAGQPGATRVDNTSPGFDERPPAAFAPPPVIPPPVIPPPATPPPAAPVETQRPSIVPPTTPAPVVVLPPVAQVAPPDPPPVWTAADEPYEPPEADDYRHRPPDDDWDQRGPGLSPLAIGGFVLLGVLAIAVGAFVAGIFTGGVAEGSPSPTPLASASAAASVAPTVQPSSNASTPASPGASEGSPVPFPDNFTARTEPCLEEPTSQEGCNSSGATVSGGSVWVWIGFRKGNDADVLRVSIVDAAGTSVGDGSLSLGTIGCGNSCNGWARFRFSNLSVGNYTIRVTRNDAAAAEAPFTVTG